MLAIASTNLPGCVPDEGYVAHLAENYELPAGKVGVSSAVTIKIFFLLRARVTARALR